MTFKEFHILNESSQKIFNPLKTFINNDKEIKEKLKDSLEIVKQNSKITGCKININNFKDENKKKELEEILNDNGGDITLSKATLKNALFDGKENELENFLNTNFVDEPKSGFGEPKSGFGEPKSGSGEPKSGSGEPKSGSDDEKIVNNFFANKDFTPKIANNYSDFKIEGSNFLQKSLNLNDYGILYSAIKNFGIKHEHIKEIKEIVSLLKDAAEKDSDSKLSLEEYVSAMKKLSTPTTIANGAGAGKALAKEPNIIKFVLFLAKLHTIHDKNFQTASRIISKGDVERFLTDENDETRKENESLLYSFFTINGNNLAPNTNTIFGEILSELSKFNVSFKLDDILNDKMSTLKQIDDFVKNPPEAKPEEKKPEKEGLASRVRGQYLSKRITDNKRNLDRYDRETEKLKDDEGKLNSDNSHGYNKKADENQAGKIASRETYGFNIDKPTADEDSIDNFGERIKHLFQNEILNITGALRIKGIASDRSEANIKNNAISRTWEEAIMRSNNKILIEGLLSRNFGFRGLTDNYAGILSKRKDDNGEYVSNAEERANKNFEYYLQEGTKLINTYVKKMKDAAQRVEAGKTYAQRVDKEWGITKAYYDLLRKLFDLKLACKKDCEEGGIAKVLKGIRREYEERKYGDKEYREKNAISNADAVKKMLEKQIVNVKEPNELQRIAKLVLFDILFGGSKTAKAALEKLKTNECFTTLGLENVKDNTKQKTYKTPDELFRAVRVNPEEITEDGLTQLQKSLNRTDCLAQINKFKEENKTKKENTNSKTDDTNADAVKKMLEKQLLNVQPVNDLQVIAKLCLYNILFNSKSTDDAINSINNGNFSNLGLDNVKDYTNVTTSGIRIDLLKPSKVYNKPADLFSSIGINPKEITEDGLTQLQKSLNKEDCIAKVNEFKNFFGNVKSKITPAASISFEELFRKKGFVIKEESQEVINARNLVANELKKGIDLTDIVKKINLAEHSIKTAAFKQAIAGNVLLNGFENGEKVYKLFNAEQFAKIKAEQLKYKQAIEKDQTQQNNNNNQQTSNINNQTDDKSDLEHAADFAGSHNSVVTTNAVDSTYGNGYQKQTPQSRMKEIIYKKGNYTVKTRQMI